MIRPTIRQLEYIVTVADVGRIGAAAAKLHVSQPSLSAQLAEVEADLGVALFHRDRRGATPTEEGREIVRRARLILRDMADLRAAASGGGAFVGRLRLGVLPSISPYLLPNVVKRLHSDYQDLRLVVREESTRDLDEGLRSGRLDMIISTPEDHASGLATPLFKERLWAALALDDPLAKSGAAIRLDKLANRTFLTLGPQHRLSHIVAGLAGQVGGHLSDEYEGTSLDAIRAMAAAGVGVAILPEIYTKTEAQRGTDVRLRRIDVARAQRDIALVEPHRSTASQKSGALAQVLREEAAKLLSK